MQQRRWHPWFFDLVPAMFMDFSVYVTIFTIQHILDHEGVSPDLLATTVAVYSGAYVVCCPLFGALLRGWVRLPPMAGIILSLVCMLAFSQARSLWHFQLLLTLFALAMALYWPSYQVLVGSESDAEDLPRRLAIFNMGWTSGKASGLLVAGLLFETFKEPRSAFYVPFVLILLITCIFLARFFLIKKGSASREEGEQPLEGSNARAVPRAFFLTALALMFVLWGSQSAILSQIPVLGRSLGFSPTLRGALLGTMVLSQAVTFAFLKRWRGWIYEWRAVFGAASLAALAVLALPFSIHPAMAFCCIALLGAAIGLGYSLSLFYALAGEPVNLRAGIHEANLGFGGLVLTLAFGKIVVSFELVVACSALAALIAVVGLLATIILRYHDIPD